MSQFPNLNQATRPLYNFSGACGASAQLLLPIWQTRSYFLFSNTSSHDMTLLFGGATATATLTSGVISSFSVTNAGFGYTYPPLVKFFGGGYPPNGVAAGTEGVGWAAIGAPPPTTSNLPAAKAVLSGGAVASITVLNGGSGFVTAPLVYLENDPRDPVGAAIPTSTVGILIKAGSAPFIMSAEFCTNAQVSLIGTQNDTFACFAAP